MLERIAFASVLAIKLALTNVVSSSKLCGTRVTFPAIRAYRVSYILAKNDGSSER